MKAIINEIVIHGIKYQAVDERLGDCNFTCKDCDIYKAKIPQNMVQLPLCCVDKYIIVNKSCCKQYEKGIKRIWKKV